MIGILILIAFIFCLAIGFSWLADQSGGVSIELLGNIYTTDSLALAAAALLALIVVIAIFWMIFSAIWRSPKTVNRFFKTRRREKGWHAISQGMIAIGSGDTALAKKSVQASKKFLPKEPAAQLLAAQAAQLVDDRKTARGVFENMLENEETRLLGLRGLYIEAEREGAGEAARQYVEKAAEAKPGLAWSGKALLAAQAAEGNWDKALVTLHTNAGASLYDKRRAKRLRAVLLTAHAQQLEDDGDPQKAKEKALEAHRLAVDLVPAATTAARLLTRENQVRKASKVIEATWKKEPHPDLMEAYLHVRPGDGGQDRLKRAQSLTAMRPNHPDAIMGVTRAYIDLQEWDKARETLKALATNQPTERVCLLMSEIEEGAYGDRGRVREWLTRAVRSNRDPVWVADGFVSETWAPISPVTGELDSFEWKVPVEQIGVSSAPVLEEIPSGPREISVVADVVKEPQETKKEAVPAIEPTPIIETKVTPVVKPDSDSVSAKEAPIKAKPALPDQVILDKVDESRPAAPLANGSTPSSKARPIDDPGTKEDASKSKRFKLFG